MQASEHTLLCAFDYAIGRTTYISQNVARDLLANAYLLSNSAKSYIVKEIDRRHEHNTLGHPTVDAPYWLQLREELAKRTIVKKG